MTVLQSAIARVPKPVRIIFAVWALISVGFYISSPVSTENLSPAVRSVILLPATLVSLGLAIYILWEGGLTLLRTAKSVTGAPLTAEAQSPTGGGLIGGIGALNIYMIAFFAATFGIADLLGSYAVSIALSAGVIAGMLLMLQKKKSSQKTSKFFFGAPL